MTASHKSETESSRMACETETLDQMNAKVRAGVTIQNAKKLQRDAAVSQATDVEKVYVAGPVRNVPDYQEAFDKAADLLRAQGHFVISPAELEREHGWLTSTEPVDWVTRTAINHQMSEVCWVQKIALLPGWEDSVGTKGEVAVALSIVLGNGGGNQTMSFVDAMTGDEIPRLKILEGLAAGYARMADRERAAVIEDQAWLDIPLEEAEEHVDSVDLDVLPISQKLGGNPEKNNADNLSTSFSGQPLPPGHQDVAVSDTGGRKGRKPAQYSLIPVTPLRMVAERYGRGAAIYGARNSEKGYSYSLSYDAMLRHAADFWNGEDDDPGMPGNPHLAAVCWHALNLMMLAEKHPKFDDRPNANGVANG